MATPSPDELFQRFLLRGDAEAVGELFDQTAPHLARVAWHVTHDAGAVEDLVQTTFLTALTSARTYDRSRPVVPWLLGILVHHARNARRATGAKPIELEHEPLDARTPEREVEGRELSDAVQRAVADLPELYRDVVASWLLDDARPREIAKRTGKPESTVRVQLHRGLELLRSALPAGAAAAVAASLLSPRSLARARTQVIERARELALGPAAVGATLGGVLMIKWMVGVAAVIVLAAVVGWIATQRNASPQASTASVAEGTLEAPTVADATIAESQRVEVPVAAPDTQVASAKPAPGWWLVGQVDGVSDRELAHVSSTDGAGFEGDVSGARFEVDVSALFRDRAGAPRSFVVRYDHPRFLATNAKVDVAAQIELAAAYAAERVELHVDLAPTPAELIVEGRAVASVDDLSSVVVALFAFDGQPQMEQDPTEFTRCRADGSFRVRSARAGVHELAAAYPGLHPATRVLARDARGRVDVGEVALDLGEHLAGVVQVAPASVLRASAITAWLLDARPLARLDVRPRTEVWRTRPQFQLAWSGERFEWFVRTVDAEVDGAFRIDGLAHASYRIGASTAWSQANGGHANRLSAFGGDESHDVTAPQDALLFDLRRNWLRLEIKENQQPLSGASVSLRRPSGGSSGVTLDGSTMDLCWSRDESPTITVELAGYERVEFVATPQEADGRTRVIEMKRASELTEVVFQPVFQCDMRAATVSVWLNPLGPEPLGVAADATFRGDELEWRMHDVHPGRYQLFIGPTADSPRLSCTMPSVVRDFAAGTAVVPLVFEAGGQFTVELRASDWAMETVAVFDRAGGEVTVQLSYFDPQLGRKRTISSTRPIVPVGVRVETESPLAPGDYKLVVAPRGERTTPLERVVHIDALETAQIVIELQASDDR